MNTLRDWFASALRWLAARRIVDAAELVPAAALCALVLAGLLVRRRRGWAATVCIVALNATVLGALILVVVEKRLNLSGGPIPWAGRAIIVGCCAAVGVAAANLHRSTWRRRCCAVLAVPVLVAGATLGVNKVYGIDETLGALVGYDQPTTISLPARSDAGRIDPTTWRAPDGMPSTGTTGYVRIAPTVSGFGARSAGIYLPPAALVPDAPRLPVVIMMMGQPGNPDPTMLADVLDAYAAGHAGVAPIVVLADQLGSPDDDTLCLDTSRYGNVETYVTTDVVTWIRDNLNVSQDRNDWTIAGYSNGGLCSILFGAKHPELFGTILDLSGELYPGEEHPDWNLENVFGGDQAAYDETKPLTVLGRNHYEDMWAYFSYGTEDGAFGPDAVTVSQAAGNAGMTVRLDPLEGVDHLEAALRGGFTNGLAYWSEREGFG